MGRATFSMRNYGLRTLTLCLLAVLACLGVSAEDRRTSPIDAYILIDNSQSMSPVLSQAVSWLDREIVNGTLQDGDHVVIWSMAGTATVVARLTIEGSKSRDEIKKQLQAIAIAKAPCNVAAALKAAAREEAARSNREPIAYVLVASSLSGGSESQNESAADYLKYSRVMDHSGWKAVVVGLGNVSEKAQAATRSYMAGSAAPPSR